MVCCGMKQRHICCLWKNYTKAAAGLSVIGMCLLAGCSASAHITVTGNAGYTVKAEFLPGALLEKNTAHLLNQTNTGSVFNRDELTASLTENGLAVTDIRLHGVMGLTVEGTLPKTHTVLKECVQYNAVKKTLSFVISPENVHALVQMFPPESRSFIDMLSAPLFTGERMTKEEYEELIAVAYGKKIAAELQKAVFTLSIDVPYQIRSAHIAPVGSIEYKNGQPSRALIRIPLTDLLCATETIRITL